MTSAAAVLDLAPTGQIPVMLSETARDGLEAILVSPELASLVAGTAYQDDPRPLSPICNLLSSMSDDSIARCVGGLETLIESRATMPQLAREVRLARERKGLFNKDGFYILYFEGHHDPLVTVSFFWDRSHRAWRLFCNAFNSRGRWSDGTEVYGNKIS